VIKNESSFTNCSRIVGSYFHIISWASIFFDNCPKPNDMIIEYHPIGKFHSNLTPQTSAPHQGILKAENKGTIEIYKDYHEAVQNLGEYEYIIVQYYMHWSNKWYPSVRPPGSKRTFGLFATRSPNRPNPIGFAVIKLYGIIETRLHVSGLDAFDGTPVVDNNPWLPSIDCPSDNGVLKIESEIGLGK